MNKTVRVVDEAGIEYKPTYPKRAAGLVKHGRARYTDECTICLVRPPHIQNEEDMEMSENPESSRIYPETGAGTEKQSAPSFSIEYVLTMLERIQQDSGHIVQAVKELGSLDAPDAPSLQYDGRGEAIGRVIEAREQTNREMIALLREMYEDLRDGNDKRSRLPDPSQLLALVQQEGDGEIRLRAFELLEKLYD